MPLTIADWLQLAQQRYDAVGLGDLAMAEGRVMLAKHLQLNFADVLLNTDLPLPKTQTLDAWVTQRLPADHKSAMPMAYVLNEAWFHGQPFYVDNRVLIPRPETEVLADWAIAWINRFKQPVRVLDVGTGSGIIACTIARHCPLAHVDATDICPQALAVAKRNAVAMGLALAFYHGNGLAAVPRQTRYDLILSNPPYIPDADWATLCPDVQQEPRLALTSGPDGLSIIKTLLADAPHHLNPGGWLALELEHRQWPIVAALATGLGWQIHPPLCDVEGKQRFLLANL